MQGTQLRKGVVGAQPGASRLRAAASALSAVPANPLRAPARQPPLLCAGPAPAPSGPRPRPSVSAIGQLRR